MDKNMLKEFSEILKTFNELLEVSVALLEWIDAVPNDTVLPTMPGVDRDWVDSVIYKAKFIDPEHNPEPRPHTAEPIPDRAESVNPGASSRADGVEP